MAAEEASEPKKKSPLKWILLLLILIILGGGGYFAYTKFFAGGEEEKAAEETPAEEQGEATKDMGPSSMITLPPFLVNLADPLGRRYIKLTIDAELNGEKSGEIITKNMPKVRDAIIMLLSSKTYADVATMENKMVLKNEIIKRLNLLLGKALVKNIYFTEMVIQ